MYVFTWVDMNMYWTKSLVDNVQLKGEGDD